MSNILRPPSLGPLVGHTTADSTRIWIRGAEAESSRTVGVAALLQGKEVIAKTVQYCRLHREYDRTGVFLFDKLEADTEYKIVTASLTVDTIDPDAVESSDDLLRLLPKPSQWQGELENLPADLCHASVRTMPAGDGQPISFLLGSCRYPGLFRQQQKKADQIFGTVFGKIQASGNKKPRFILMVGDQIYADTLNRHVSIGNADTVEEFRERYTTAYGTRNMRKVLGSVPNYMILDDHEIEDNWHYHRISDSDKRTLFQIAISAYKSYQWIHSPRNYGHRLFYSFEAAGHPFFVMDSRTQRMVTENDVEENHLLGYPGHPSRKKKPKYPGQIDRLCDWLIDQQKRIKDRPKFIVSPSVFVPNSRKTRKRPHKSDSWPAFPATRRTILETIVENKIQNVVFLCGDVHCSITATMEFFEGENEENRLDLRAYCITSSAFYWPFPFADGDPNTFVHDSKLKDTRDPFYFGDGNKYTMHYEATDFEQDDNFIQVNVGDKEIQVECFGRDPKKKALYTRKLPLA